MLIKKKIINSCRILIKIVLFVELYLGANWVQPVSEIETPPFYAGSGKVQIVQIWLSPLRTKGSKSS